jgi:hypothetical protein
VDENQINPEEFSDFSIPESFLDQLYEFTGAASANKGFVLVYSDQNGRPMVYSRQDSQIIEMGLRKSMEKYLIELESSENPVDLMDGDEEDV